MAQLFDPATITGVDNNTYLAVPSLIDSQVINEVQHHHPSASEDDVFQCGKCKKLFNSLSLFVGHKQQGCGSSTSGSIHASAPQYHQIYPSQTPSAGTQHPSNGASNLGFNHLPTNIVLPEEMMTLTLDSNAAGTLQLGGSSTVNSYLTSVQMGINHQQNTGQTVVLSNESACNTSMPGAAQIQLHPITVMPSQPGSSLMPAQPESVSGIAGGVDGSGTIAVVLDEAAQGLQGRESYGNTEQVGSMSAAPVIQWQVSPPAQPSTDKPKRKTKKSSPNRQLSCDWCKKTFQKNFDLEQHKRAHTGEKPFQCVVCGRAFSQKSNVKKHMQTHKVWPLGSHNNLPEQPAPQLMVVQEKDVRAGTRTDQGRSDKEGSCSMATSSQSNSGQSTAEQNGDEIASMKWHFLIDSSYVCPYCPNTHTRFDTYYQLKTHLVTHKTEQLYKCVLRGCDKTFGELDEFLEHTKEHESRGEMIYHCHVCMRQFATIDELGTHQYTHSIDPQTGCSDNRRKKSEWKWRCVECGNCYASTEALEHHVATTSHSHPCPQCSKVYPSPRLLRRHLMSHRPEEEREFTCDICNKAMKSEYYLKAHRRIHTGELPYACELCGKRFNRKDKVNRHMLTHDLVKKFVCPFKDITGCEKAFARSDKLKEHIHQHKKINVDTVTKISRNAISTTGSVTLLTKRKGAPNQPDPMTCKHCQSCRFGSSVDLLAHELLCSQVPKLKCKKCELTFNSEESYALHDCKPLTETVLISHTNSIKVNHTKKRLTKKRKVNRIELSPPPMRRSNRSRRTRLADTGNTEEESNAVCTDSET
ncbi:zinc finger protein 341-like isoform X2 [Watersipora subatra]|uniref:zinc finger protein 341-like isoform X2 n=1 Tax=Watersipora subatra TaxID=2589382 RepID=UPI00355C641D